MTHTTRPARTSAKPKKTAAHYPALKPDRYGELDAHEQRRHDLHLDVDTIMDAGTLAGQDLSATGFRSSYRARDGSVKKKSDEAALNSVEAASQHLGPEHDWIPETVEAIAAVRRAARLARDWWPATLAVGTVVTEAGEEITVGARNNTVATCSWCGLPAPSGRHANGRTMVSRVEGHAVHANGPPNCYMAASRAAGEAKTTISAVLAGKVMERRTA